MLVRIVGLLLCRLEVRSTHQVDSVNGHTRAGGGCEALARVMLVAAVAEGGVGARVGE